MTIQMPRRALFAAPAALVSCVRHGPYFGTTTLPKRNRLVEADPLNEKLRRTWMLHFIALMVRSPGPFHSLSSDTGLWQYGGVWRSRSERLRASAERARRIEKT